MEISDFCKWVIFEKLRHCRPAVQSKCLMSVSCSFNVLRIVVVSMYKCIYIYIYVYIYIYIKYIYLSFGLRINACAVYGGIGDVGRDIKSEH